MEVNNTLQKQLHQHAAGMSAERCSTALQAHATWSSHSGLTARPLAPSSLHHEATRIPGGVGVWQMSWGLTGSAGCEEAAANTSPLFNEQCALSVQSCWAFSRSWSRTSVLKLAVSNVAKSNASLLLEKQWLSICKYFHWFSLALFVVQTWWRATPVPESCTCRGCMKCRRTPLLLMRSVWWMTRQWMSMSEGQSVVWAMELILFFSSTLLLTGSEFPTRTPWKGSSKKHPVISGASKHQSQSNSWTSTLPLVPGSLRAAGLLFISPLVLLCVYS